MILVTGATGFIGSHICRELVGDGQQVRALHRPTSSLVNLEGLPLERAVGDITQPESLEAALSGVEVVFHTAAQLGQVRDPARRYTVTVDGTRNLLSAAAKAGVRRVIHTSSVAALGVPYRTPERLGAQPLLMDERHTWNLPPEHWRYGHSKYLAELEVQAAVARGLDVVIVNPAVVLGAGDLNRVSGEVIIQVAKGRVPISTQGGLNVIHIADVVRGHLAAWKLGRTGERYILGGENLPHQQFLHLIAQVAGVRPPQIALPGRLVQALARPVTLVSSVLPLPIAGEALRRAGFYFYYDTNKARIELGLHDLRPPKQAVEDAYHWYRQQGMLDGKIAAV